MATTTPPRGAVKIETFKDELSRLESEIRGTIRRARRRNQLSWKPTGDLVASPEHGGGWTQSFDHGALSGGLDLARRSRSTVPSTRSGSSPADRVRMANNRREPQSRPRPIQPFRRPIRDLLVAGHRRTRRLRRNPEKWLALGDAGSKLGYPTTDEMDNIDNANTGRKARCHRFQGGYISWSPDTGAHEHINGTTRRLTRLASQHPQHPLAASRYECDQPPRTSPGTPGCHPARGLGRLRRRRVRHEPDDRVRRRRSTGRSQRLLATRQRGEWRHKGTRRQAQGHPDSGRRQGRRRDRCSDRCSHRRHRRGRRCRSRRAARLRRRPRTRSHLCQLRWRRRRRHDLRLGSKLE